MSTLESLKKMIDKAEYIKTGQTTLLGKNVAMISRNCSKYTAFELGQVRPKDGSELKKLGNIVNKLKFGYDEVYPVPTPFLPKDVLLLNAGTVSSEDVHRYQEGLLLA
ncbi:unnamed protein product [Penicillium manginii]